MRRPACAGPRAPGPRPSARDLRGVRYSAESAERGPERAAAATRYRNMAATELLGGMAPTVTQRALASSFAGGARQSKGLPNGPMSTLRDNWRGSSALRLLGTQYQARSGARG